MINQYKKSLKGKNNPFYGKHHSTETKLKLSLARKNRTLKKEVCVRCKNKMLSRTYNRKYCDDCKLVIRKEIMKRVDLKRKNNPKRRLQKIRIKRKYNHTEKGKETNRLWRKTEKGISNSIFCNKKRRERKAGLIRGYTNKEWLDKVESANGRCMNCPAPFTLIPRKDHYMTMEHNPAISKMKKGDIITIDMLFVWCWKCNSERNQHRI